MVNSYYGMSQIEREMYSSGKSFLGLYMEYVITCINEGMSKQRIVELLHARQVGFSDKDIAGTQNRVNALFNIIYYENVVKALNIVLDMKTERVKGAKKKATETLDKIYSGELKLPKLA